MILGPQWQLVSLKLPTTLKPSVCVLISVKCIYYSFIHIIHFVLTLGQNNGLALLPLSIKVLGWCKVQIQLGLCVEFACSFAV